MSDELINACDAGREGELIFRYIVQAAKAKQPVRRLWLQSMTPAAIREAFEQLRTDDEMLPLADAARSRSEADWLVGINGTRAMTAFNSKEGGFYLTTVGRVQTPTLAIVAEREDKIRTFRAARLLGSAGDASTRRPERTKAAGSTRSSRRATTSMRAPNASGTRQARLRSPPPAAARPGTATEEAKPSTQLSPLLFDLTSLQREANSQVRLLGQDHAVDRAGAVRAAQGADLPADRCARAARGLCRRREEDDGRTGRALRRIASSRRRSSKQGWVQAEQARVRQRKVSDHFAIIPTLQTPHHLSEVEAKLYDLVVKRFLSMFFPAAEYLVTTRITEVEGHAFKTEGKVLVEPGWLAIYGREAMRGTGFAAEDRAGRARADQRRRNRSHSQHARRARYTEATLLTAMEGAGKLIEDDDLRAAMAGKGLGTPATRSHDHRGPDRPALHGARRQGPAADAQGVRPDDAAERPRRRGADRARTHRRVGVQAVADGARQAQARSLHERDRRHDEEDRRAREELPVGHGADRRSGHAATPCPKCGKARSSRTTGASPARSATSRSEASGQPDVRGRGSRATAARPNDRPAAMASSARWGGRLRRC